MIRTILPLTIFAFILPIAAQASLTLAKGGKTSYSIVISPDASPTVSHAANELAADLQTMSNADFPVVTHAVDGPEIFVGPSDFLQEKYPSIKLSDLPDEGFVIRTEGANLVLSGKDDRGTLYSVYTFLEEHLGVRWFSPNDTVLPDHNPMTIPSIDEKQAPAFMYRDTDNHIVLGNAAWDAHLMLNGVSVPDQEDLGGINRLFNGAENFYQLVPPSKYFADHPEYFSLINGQRRDTGDSQLCLTNPDVFHIIVDELTAQAKADPKLLTLGLSPNDAGDGECQCPNCKAEDEKYGAPSGTLLNFVNKVAAAVQANLPDRKIWVETLAYQYTEKPPTPGTISPASNVLVCLAPIHMCDAHAIDKDPVNKASLDNLLGWGKVAPGHLQVWHYVTNYANYMQPFPDWDEIGADMKFYHDHGVSGMFCEGNYNSNGEMMAMRTWVLAHLFWNPNQNVWSLIKEYCDGYYGHGGKYIYQYLRLMHDQFLKPNVHLFIYDSPHAAYLSPEVMKEANKLFDEAESATVYYPDELNRVREARISIRYVDLVDEIPNAQSTAQQKEAFLKKLKQFAEDINYYKFDYVSEGRPVASWITQLENDAQ